MSHSTSNQIRGSRAPSVTELVSETRIDLAHMMAGGLRQAETAPDEQDASAGGIDLGDLECDEPSPAADPDAVGQQVAMHAAQLAKHLRQRQQELDHREAELNARTAQLDRDTRTARLWLEEREAALEAADSQPQTVVIRDEDLRHKLESLAASGRQLDARDAELAAEREALENFSRQLAGEREQLEAAARAQRERLASDEVRSMTEIERCRRAVEKRGEQNDRERAALEQFRTDLERTQRETLEVNLATQELWAEISATAPSASLNESLRRVRDRVDDHYRAARADLRQKEAELERLRDEIAAQGEEIGRRKRAFDDWASECRDEAEEQAARLAARSEELDRREADMAEFARVVQIEKVAMQQEIRSVRAKLVERQMRAL